MAQEIESGPPVANLRVETVDLSNDVPNRTRPSTTNSQEPAAPWVAVRLEGPTPASHPPGRAARSRGGFQACFVARPRQDRGSFENGRIPVFLFLESADKALDARPAPPG